MKLNYKKMILPIAIAMTVLSANGEGVRSLRGDVQDTSLGIESPRIDGEDIPEGEGHRSLNKLPSCNCVSWKRKCRKNPGNCHGDDDYCKENGYYCFSRDFNCGFLRRQQCNGYNSKSDYNQ
eukprot:CAMPEP_0194172376 /NCGR_PEP_ID=MMETSP0154-20130528/6868_1 /TAXON_ID=1049557 /ORGANISM="Thalassiothrix antarctica, Strain L6-D1" /LENGTH=121 /DNA_ID=CAMNT_0038885035 /DNA_START=64 /DNA_END=429 /DNA_ORIENTATION=-